MIHVEDMYMKKKHLSPKYYKYDLKKGMIILLLYHTVDVLVVNKAFFNAELRLDICYLGEGFIMYILYTLCANKNDKGCKLFSPNRFNKTNRRLKEMSNKGYVWNYIYYITVLPF